MNFAAESELKTFIKKHPEIKMLEVLMPDMNGIVRCKRIPAREFATFFREGVKGPASTVLLNVLGEFCDEVDFANLEGDPDKLIHPIANTLAPVTWLKSDTAQVLATFTELDGSPAMFDCRNILIKALEHLQAMGLTPIVATELEFYLIKSGDAAIPEPLLSKVPGTNIEQSGIQYAMQEDLWDNDDFLEDVRLACEAQNVPMTTVHSEFSPGQFEINLHHVDNPVTACDHAVLLKRIIKGVARQYGMAATFMAKPFMDIAGSGLHVHFSLYDGNGVNVFAGSDSSEVPPISDKLRHAIGGLAKTMAEAMAIFAPNANSYRRLIPGNHAPLTPNWGYNHRDVALRIPVSGDKDRRVEHRVAGADANPYLVMTALVAGVHHGISHGCDPGEMVPEGFEVEEAITLPRIWSLALDKFDSATVLPQYLGEEYCRLFGTVRRGECEQFSAQVSNIDYDWYLRSM
ncbi:MAG: glutamine synthetase family protein [Proteobacteria bacterium]|jgi:glutamine synthetase|uniref:Glutamine synthetase n=1 Tax=SAR92 bacterium BACL26 MAG-121220-bin70 TaxID=1655626 RepID=A0A0R2U4S5_9GAMM|nr:MAG: glutamine synthetase [SAR92 bacterium BACL26 MAG-121220-bin70]MDA0796626.1 glutamine synthetase family protein [Pseudomonadota bacterium]MDA1352412.1 glutamine synthetase family protein [Pseudomonadota bacterium]|tara:strand:- start:9961 stop:11340 length:1380 start_codon:yes stop_codon:yes gene_type:complete